MNNSVERFGGIGVIIENKKILLIKRQGNVKHFPNCWTPPGGKSEIGETPEETCKREVSEEVGLIIQDLVLYRTDVWNGHNIFTQRVLDYTGEIVEQDSEISESGWFTYDQACTLDLGFHYREVINNLQKDGYL